MNIAICDDEIVFRNNLLSILEQYTSEKFQNFYYYEFSCGQDILDSDVRFDIIFIDYMMNGINGIETISQLRKKYSNAYVIFASNYKDIVFDAISVNPFRFLTKPIDKSKLFEAVDAVVKDRESKCSIIVQDTENSLNHVLSEEDVVYAQAENNYTIVFTSDRSYVYKNTLSKFSKELKGHYFFRCHRSFIVNLNYVKSYSKSEIILITNERISITRTKYKEYKRIFFNFIKNKGLNLE